MSADLRLAEHANAFALHHDGWEDAARAYAHLSEPLFLAGVIALAVVGLILRRDRLLLGAALAVAASGVALAVAALLARLVDRPRPFVAHPQIHAFLAHAADPSFPSDHATAAFAIAAVLLVRFGRPALPVLLAAVALAASRVLIGLHYPTDVLAGAVIGTAAALAVCRLVPRIRPPWSASVTMREWTPGSTGGRSPNGSRSS
jgi:undecaprenyl-diphosphatase